MIYLITGDNEFACREKLIQLLSSADKTIAPLQIEINELENLDELSNKIRGESLFASDEMIVIRYLNEAAELQAKFLNLCKEVPKSTKLIISLPGLKKSNELIKQLLPLCDEKIFCDELSEFDLKKWVMERVKLGGGEIDTTTAEYLINWVGIEQLNLASEIEKLVTYEPKISRESIEKVAVASPKTTVFQMLDAMLRGDATLATKYLNDLREQRFDAGYIMGMICWQVNALSVAWILKNNKDLKAPPDLGVSPYVLRKVAPIVGKLSKRGLVDLNDLVLKTDIKLKSQSIDKDELVEQLIRKIAYLNS